MFSRNDILETINMIKEECLDIRTITMGISLFDCQSGNADTLADRIYDKIMYSAKDLVRVGNDIEKRYGIPIINKRVSVTPIAMLAGQLDPAGAVKIARTLDRAAAEAQAEAELPRLQRLISGSRDAREDLKDIQLRMSRCAGFQRRIAEVEEALKEAQALLDAIEKEGFRNSSGVLALTTAQLALSSVVYLSAIRHHILSGAGSRGSAAVFGRSGETLPENEEFRSKILVTTFENGEVVNAFESCRPLPTPDGWFENVWADYRQGKIFTAK